MYYWPGTGAGMLQSTSWSKPCGTNCEVLASTASIWTHGSEFGFGQICFRTEQTGKGGHFNWCVLGHVGGRPPQ